MIKDLLNNAKNRLLGRDRWKYVNDNADILRPEYAGELRLVNKVGTSEASISSFDSERPVLATLGAGPCVAMAGYDSSLRLGFLSHNCAGDYVDVLHDKVLEELQKITGKEIFMQIYIVGGMNGSQGLANRLRRIAKERFNATSINEDLALKIDDWRYLGKSLLLDTRDGRTYSALGGGEWANLPKANPLITLK